MGESHVTTVGEPGRFRGRVALVTGAASGIGLEAARQLAAEGAAICCADVNVTGAEQSAASIAGALAHRLDVASEADWEAVTQEILASHGRLDVLVNCAGISAASPIAETAFADWRRVLSVNLDGA